MKTLSLYIDKWFITGSINFDGNTIELSFPNGEDRIWLFFHEDIAKSRIEYGHEFENKYRKNEPHYFGDVFDFINGRKDSSILSGSILKKMTDIFRVSDIFDHLHQAVGQEEAVDTYISFSTDIPYDARRQFIEELQMANFNVLESSARISLLALEDYKKRNLFSSQGYYLALVATNDNLHSELHEYNGNYFTLESEQTLYGHGRDLRREVLVKRVVKEINEKNKFLKDQEQIDNECAWQDRYATGWLEKINNSKQPNRPVALGNISLSNARNNPAIVSIKKEDLEKDTQEEVEKIVDTIVDFVKESKIHTDKIDGIIFVGNTLTNKAFSKAIKKKFCIINGKIEEYGDNKLPRLLNVYSQIDCSQFQVSTSSLKNDAKTQEILNTQAKEEEENRQRAEDDARRQQELTDSQKKEEQEFNNAIENIKRHESDHNYEGMLEWAEKALRIRPDDDFAKEKTALAQQLLSKKRAADRQYNTIFQHAKKAFDEQRWSDAIFQFNMALEHCSDSEEASRLIALAQLRMEQQNRLGEEENIEEPAYREYTDSLNNRKNNFNEESPKWYNAVYSNWGSATAFSLYTIIGIVATFLSILVQIALTFESSTTFFISDIFTIFFQWLWLLLYSEFFPYTKSDYYKRIHPYVRSIFITFLLLFVSTDCIPLISLSSNLSEKFYMAINACLGSDILQIPAKYSVLYNNTDQHIHGINLFSLIVCIGGGVTFLINASFKLLRKLDGNYYKKTNNNTSIRWRAMAIILGCVVIPIILLTIFDYSRNISFKTAIQNSEYNINPSFKEWQLNTKFSLPKNSSTKYNQSVYKVEVVDPLMINNAIVIAAINGDNSQDNDVFLKTGKCYKYSTSLEEEKVEVCVLSFDNNVGAIVIVPQSEDVKGNKNGSFENYKSLLDLYQSKYGNGVKTGSIVVVSDTDSANILSLVFSASNYKGDIFNQTTYSWNFFSSQIYMTNKYILYVSSDFMKFLKREIDYHRHLKEQQNKREVFVEDSISREQQKSDSLRKLELHTKSKDDI